MVMVVAVVVVAMVVVEGQGPKFWPNNFEVHVYRIKFPVKISRDL